MAICCDEPHKPLQSDSEASSDRERCCLRGRGYACLRLLLAHTCAMSVPRDSNTGRDALWMPARACTRCETVCLLQAPTSVDWLRGYLPQQEGARGHTTHIGPRPFVSNLKGRISTGAPSAELLWASLAEVSPPCDGPTPPWPRTSHAKRRNTDGHCKQTGSRTRKGGQRHSGSAGEGGQTRAQRLAKARWPGRLGRNPYQASMGSSMAISRAPSRNRRGMPSTTSAASSSSSGMLAGRASWSTNS